MSQVEDAPDYSRVTNLADKRLGSTRPSVLSGMDGGGDGGGMDGLTARVASLEAHMEHVRESVGTTATDMRDVRERLRGLETKVDHLPSKGYIVTVALTALILLGGLVTFQHQVQELLHLDASSQVSLPPASKP